MKKKQQKENYLDRIPARAEGLAWRKDETDVVVLEVENTGAFNRIAQKLFHRPRVTNVHLDRHGSFVWERMDGTLSVLELANLQKEAFGDEVEPLYPRIVKYFQIMESYHFLTWKK